MLQIIFQCFIIHSNLKHVVYTTFTDNKYLFLQKNNHFENSGITCNTESSTLQNILILHFKFSEIILYHFPQLSTIKGSFMLKKEEIKINLKIICNKNHVFSAVTKLSLSY